MWLRSGELQGEEVSGQERRSHHAGGVFRKFQEISKRAKKESDAIDKSPSWIVSTIWFNMNEGLRLRTGDEINSWVALRTRKKMLLGSKPADT